MALRLQVFAHLSLLTCALKFKKIERVHTRARLLLLYIIEPHTDQLARSLAVWRPWPSSLTSTSPPYSLQFNPGPTIASSLFHIICSLSSACPHKSSKDFTATIIMQSNIDAHHALVTLPFLFLSLSLSLKLSLSQ
ncbi:hypothetical protein MPTK1_1g09440 [Marchantia polymorpha subsp. ruderalis]|uniref:Uncharacterized protein n=2 Tax=Marchantia polymorpha TaxID=3197 RepID=A0AAF6AN98_MARPO|nr:hypothetical protein MARPO_0096s0056 [Marchantia polymorpha]BBM97918.1 hypothetical protein Mp_1g09440 [Marchantia polymorpha subsp. ruderalis]|eukprot:PTQ32711.1 hypothetical protein MARPO_0096s0056 [Marchantia polymorpha]